MKGREEEVEVEENKEEEKRRWVFTGWEKKKGSERWRKDGYLRERKRGEE